MIGCSFVEKGIQNHVCEGNTDKCPLYIKGVVNTDTILTDDFVRLDKKEIDEEKTKETAINRYLDIIRNILNIYGENPSGEDVLWRENTILKNFVERFSEEFIECFSEEDPLIEKISNIRRLFISDSSSLVCINEKFDNIEYFAKEVFSYSKPLNIEINDRFAIFKCFQKENDKVLIYIISVCSIVNELSSGNDNKSTLEIRKNGLVSIKNNENITVVLVDNEKKLSGYLKRLLNMEGVSSLDHSGKIAYSVKIFQTFGVIKEGVELLVKKDYQKSDMRDFCKDAALHSSSGNPPSIQVSSSSHNIEEGKESSEITDAITDAMGENYYDGKGIIKKEIQNLLESIQSDTDNKTITDHLFKIVDHFYFPSFSAFCSLITHCQPRSFYPVDQLMRDNFYLIFGDVLFSIILENELKNVDCKFHALSDSGQKQNFYIAQIDQNNEGLFAIKCKLTCPNPKIGIEYVGTGETVKVGSPVGFEFSYIIYVSNWGKVLEMVSPLEIKYLPIK